MSTFISKKWFNAGNSIIFFIIIFGGIFLLVNINQLTELLKKLNFIYLSTAFLLAILAITISAFKFKLIISISISKTFFFKGWLQVFVKSYILNNLIPLSGIAYRAIYLKRHYDISYTQFVVATYLFGTLGLALLLSVGAFFILLDHDYGVVFYLLFLAILFSAIYFKFYILKIVSVFNYRSKKINFFLQKIGALEYQFKTIFKSQSRFSLLLVFLSSLCIDFLVYSCVFNSINQEVSWRSILYIYLAYSLSWLIRLTPGNIGIQEFMIGAVSATTGLGWIGGVALSILLRINNLIAAFFLWLLNSVPVRK